MSSAPDVTAWDGEQSEKQSILAMPGCGHFEADHVHWFFE